MATWDPQQYQRFQKERAQPFFDLVHRLPDGEVTTAADLGCGPGALTATLTERWPHATVWGVDNSPQMLAKGRGAAGSASAAFVEAGIAEWSPPRRLDRIISNAALHWVPEHQAVLQRLVGLLTPHGVLAVQMPNNHAEAAHRILRESNAARAVEVGAGRFGGAFYATDSPLVRPNAPQSRLHGPGMGDDLLPPLVRGECGPGMDERHGPATDA